MSTTINGTDNTAAAPALTGSDTDTGVFFPAANTMAFSTGGTEKMRVDSSGNVGIGTASPTQKLDVVATSRYTFNVANAYTLQTSTNTDASAFADDYKNALTHIWQTSGTERMRIASDGIITGTAGNLMLVQSTAQTTTSGTTRTFPSIPSWVKRITVMLNAISFSATSGSLAVRIGTGGTLTTTGYVARFFGYDNTSTPLQFSATTGIAGNIGAPLQTAAHTLNGVATITNVTGNIWTSTFYVYNSNVTDVMLQGGGSITLAGALDIVGITLLTGTAFDAGSINILYE